MAEEDIVQRIRIEGEGDIISVFEQIANSGKKAFTDIGSAVNAVGTSFTRLQSVTRQSFQTIQQGGTAATHGMARVEAAARSFGESIRNVATVTKTSFGNIGSILATSIRLPSLSGVANSFKATFDSIRATVTRSISSIQNVVNGFTPSKLTKELTGVERAAYNFGTALRGAAGAFFTFAKRTALSIGGIGLAIAAFRSLSRAATGAAAAERAASRERQADLKDERSDTQALANIQIQAAEQQRQLANNYAAGKVSLEDYTAGLQELQQQQQSNIQTFLAQDAAEEQARRRQQESQRKLAQQQSFDQVADKVGSQAASAFLQLGNVIDQVTRKAQQILGPVLAQIVTGITQAIQQNMPAITAFLEEIRASIAPLATDIPTAFREALPGIFEFIRGFVDGIKFMVGAVQTLIQVFNGVAAVINTVFGTNFTGPALAAVAIVLSFSGALALVLPVIKLVATGIALLAGVFGAIPVAIALIIAAIVAWLAYSGRLTAAWNAVAAFFTSLWEGIKTNASTTLETIQNAWNGLLDFFKNLPSKITGYVSGVWESIKSGASKAVDYVVGIWNGIVGKVANVFNQIKQMAIDTWNAIPEGLRNLFSSGGAVGGPASGGAVAAAGGGHIRGPGTSRSDSIPAWLSDGEFVQRTAAVRKYGVGFMRMINNLQFPTDWAQRFAGGGLVGLGVSPVLKLADGGAASGMRNVLNLTLDNETFNGLQVPDDTFNKLKKHAVKKSMSPRKPNWF